MDSSVSAESAGSTWRRVLRTLCLAYSAVLIAVNVLVIALGMTPVPPFLIAAVLFGAAGIWLGTSTARAPVIFTLVVSIAHLGLMWFLVFGLAQITSPVEFIMGAAFLLLGLPTLPISVAALRRGDAPGGSRTRTVIAGLSALALVGAVVGALIAPDDDAESGDVVVAAEDFEFVPSEVSAAAGERTFYLDNRDLVAHDLSIRTDEDADALDGATIAPGRKGSRATYELTPGSYQIFCSLHPGMDAELTVT